MEQFADIGGLRLCYETRGDASQPTLLLVMGLGAQMVAWPDEMVDALAETGFHVVRYDNRDVGRSDKFDDYGMPDFGALVEEIRAGVTPPKAPYYLKDMAADGMALLDHLGIEKAHVVGASMGGMIAQQMAIDFPERLLTLTSIFSTTSDPSLPQATQEAMDFLTQPYPNTDDMDAMVDHSVAGRKIIGGDGFEDTPEVRANHRMILERSFYPVGSARQRAAIMASGSRADALTSVATPTLVIHGDKDPLVRVEGGIHTADVMPNARLEILEGMGHALYPRYLPKVIDLIVSHAEGQSSKAA